MKKKLIAVMIICVSAACLSQTFKILSVTPARRFVVPNVVTGYVAGVCVLTPDSNATYHVQVATNPAGPWRDRLRFTAHNGPTSCWNVSLAVQETNMFFVRARLSP